MDILQTKNLTKYYGEEPLIVKALDGITLQIEQGSFTAIVGTSGSGKSTLLHMLGGLDTPTGGSVVVDGQSLSGMSRSELTIFRRRKIGFIFQNYNLIPNLTIYDNIVLPVELDGRNVDDEFLKKIVSALGLEDKLQRKPNKLSGGQQQRAAIARALITKPALILADEPTGNLDSRTSHEVVGLLQMTGKRFHQTIVMITHNDEIAQIADRTIRIEDGRIAESRWQG
ncbi:MAG: ABC transporter ATP-binding protein [Lachnospiraceae bacterium]